MTTRQMLETIKRIFPSLTDTELLLHLNRKLKEFCNKTKILKDIEYEALSSDTVEYEIDEEVDSITNVRFYTSEGVELYGEDTLRYRIRDGKITFFDYYSEPITTIPDQINEIVYDVIKVPEELKNDTDEPEIPEQFHRAIIDGVLAEFLAEIPSIQVRLPDGSVRLDRDFRGAEFYEMKYEKKVREAKRYSTEDKDQTSYEVTYHQI